MDDEQILERGGDEEDIRKYAEENGATNPMSKLDELDKEFIYELRMAIGYSGGASDKDIVSCKTKYGHEASMRFDVLCNSLVPIMQKLIAKARLEESEAMKKLVSEIRQCPVCDGLCTDIRKRILSTLNNQK